MKTISRAMVVCLALNPLAGCDPETGGEETELEVDGPQVMDFDTPEEEGEAPDPGEVEGETPPPPRSMGPILGSRLVEMDLENNRLLLEGEHGEWELTVEVDDQDRVLMGDVILGTVAELENLEGARTLIEHANEAWTDSTVPYYFDEASFNACRAASAVAAIEDDLDDAIAIMETQSPLRFTELANDPGNDGTVDYVRIVQMLDGNNACLNSGTSLADATGMEGGMQSLFVAGSGVGTFVHEFGHHLGLFHEHQRPDRESHITWDFNCTQESGSEPGQPANGNLTKIENKVVVDHDYDVDSIMHYVSSNTTGTISGNSCVRFTIDDPGECTIATCTNGERTRGVNDFSPGDQVSLTALHPRSSALADRFGYGIATGDFDGDGVVEAVFSVPGSDEGANGGGAAAVFDKRRDSNDYRAQRLIGQFDGGYPEDWDGTNATVASGDFDADGFEDIVIGFPKEDIGSNAQDAGVIFLFRGSISGPVYDRYFNQGYFGWASEAGDNFGAELEVGDFDGDGVDDLAITSLFEAYGSGPAEGAVYVARGSGTTSGEALLRWTSVSQRTMDSIGNGGGYSPGALGISHDYDQFGFSLSAGDLDGDNIDDLVVGAPGDHVGSNVGAGAIFLFQGSSTGMKGWARLDQTGLGANEAGDAFGFSVAVADTDGVGAHEIVVGAPFEDIGSGSSIKYDAGHVFMFRAVGDNLYTDGSFGQSMSSYAEPYDRFGEAVSYADGLLAVSAPGERSGSGPQYGSLNYYRTGFGELVEAGFIWGSQFGTGADFMGQALEVGENGDHILVGSPSANLAGNDSGGVMVVDILSGTSNFDVRQILDVSGETDR